MTPRLGRSQQSKRWATTGTTSGHRTTSDDLNLELALSTRRLVGIDHRPCHAPAEPGGGNTRAGAWSLRGSDCYLLRTIGAYLGRVSRLAHACATAELAGSLPGSVAQPPFSTKEPCCHELTFISSVRFAAASAPCWNLSAQMGASASTTAVAALFSAISLAGFPMVHPPQVKPMLAVAANPMQAPCKRRVIDSPCRIGGNCMVVPFARHVSERGQRTPGWVPVSKLN